MDQVDQTGVQSHVDAVNGAVDPHGRGRLRSGVHRSEALVAKTLHLLPRQAGPTGQSVPDGVEAGLWVLAGGERQ